MPSAPPVKKKRIWPLLTCSATFEIDVAGSLPRNPPSAITDRSSCAIRPDAVNALVVARSHLSPFASDRRNAASVASGSNAADPNVVPDTPTRGPACGSVALSTGDVVSLHAHAVGAMRKPPIITSSDTPAHRLIFGTNAVANSAIRPTATTTSIAGCAHAWKFGARFVISRCTAIVTPTIAATANEAVGFLRMTRTAATVPMPTSAPTAGASADV